MGSIVCLHGWGSNITTALWEQLAKVLNATGYSPKKYKEHSFRIGGATAAVSSKCSELKIQAIGRWKSGAFRRYIRI